MTDISENVSEKIYQSKEIKRKDLEKAIDHMNDKGYEVGTLEDNKEFERKRDARREQRNR